MTKAAYDNTTEEYRKQMLASVRSPRLGAPEDIAAMVAFLFSDVGAYKQNRAPSVGEEAQVANADEAVGHDVEQEAADELLGLERHDLHAITVGVVLPAEADDPVVEAEESVVGEGDPCV